MHYGVVERLLRQRRLAHRQQLLLSSRAEWNVRWWHEHLCSEQGLVFTNTDDPFSVHHHQTPLQEETDKVGYGRQLGQFRPSSHF